MKSTIFLILTGFVLLSSSFKKPQIIFDTDFGGDVDDLGALCMLHHFIDRKECDLLAIGCWSTEKYAVSAIDAVNRFYKHPDIPLGVRKDTVQIIDWNYSKSITNDFPYERNYNDVPDVVDLYRKILTSSPNKSIIFVAVGPLRNIENLINSQPDSISNLNGKELIAKKVKEFVIMGGKFPEGVWEWNFDGGMPGVTKYVIQNISLPITFSGFEVGEQIKVGSSLNQIEQYSPLYVGYKHFSANAPWIKENFKGEILDNSCFDQTAVLYAVRRGNDNYWTKVTDGLCIPDGKGGNSWITAKKSNHSYLKLKIKNTEMAKLIESIMLGRF